MAADDPIAKQFEILRKRARQQAVQAGQREAEGLKRRFAQIGQVGSGAQIRAEAQAAERGARRLAQAEEAVGLAELRERQRQKEIGEQRAFARGEREAGQRFAAEQAGLGRRFAAEQAGIGRGFQKELAEAQRKFARGERLTAQEFGALQAERGREFARQQAQEQRGFVTGEREAAEAARAAQLREQREFAGAERIGAQEFAAQQAEAARGFQEDMAKFQSRQRDFDRALQQEAFDEGVRRFELEFNRDSDTIAFNRKMSEENASRNLFDEIGLGGLMRGEFGGFTSVGSPDIGFSFGPGPGGPPLTFGGLF